MEGASLPLLFVLFLPPLPTALPVPKCLRRTCQSFCFVEAPRSRAKYMRSPATLSLSANLTLTSIVL